MGEIIHLCLGLHSKAERDKLSRMSAAMLVVDPPSLSFWQFILPKCSIMFLQFYTVVVAESY